MLLRIAAVTCALVVMSACGDDEDGAVADGGKDSGPSESPRAGRGGAGGSSGSRAGAGGRSGAGGGGSKADAGESSDGTDAGADEFPVTIRFQAKFGGQKLTCGASYTLPSLGSSAITPTDFRFYVQDVRLVTASGQEAPVVFDDRAPVQTREVALLDFTNDDGHCGAGTTAENTTITGKVAPGAYTSIVFSNGVPDSLNHQDITVGEPPLDDATTHWGWANGYRFILSGVSVTSDDPPDADAGTGIASGASFVHVGAGGCAGSTQSGFTCARPNRNRIALSGFDATKNVIVADLARVFANVDLSKPLECHGPSSPACGPAYTALGLNAADGSARSTQDVFRVE